MLSDSIATIVEVATTKGPAPARATTSRNWRQLRPMRRRHRRPPLHLTWIRLTWHLCTMFDATWPADRTTATRTLTRVRSVSNNLNFKV